MTETQAAQLVGRYDLRPGVAAAITCEGGRLFIGLPGQPAAALQQVREGHFLAQALQVKVIFDQDGSLLLEQPGGSLRGKRVQ